MSVAEVCGFAVRLQLAVDASNAVTDPIVRASALQDALVKSGLAVEEIVGMHDLCGVDGSYVILVQGDVRRADEAARVVKRVYEHLAQDESALAQGGS